jgi:DNA-binding CsgD family transcriptional regulator
MRTAGALSLFWEMRGYLREGVSWLERLVAAANGDVSLKVHVDALVFGTFHYMLLGDAQAAMSFARRAVDLAEDASEPDSPILAFARDGLASAARAAGDHQLAFRLTGQNISYYRQKGPSFYLGMALLAQGENALQLGHYEIAREKLNESLDMAQKDGDKFRTAHVLNTLGDLSRLERNYAEAAETYSRGLHLLRELDAQRDLASLASNLGFVSLHQGDIERAHQLLLESMDIHQAQQNKPGMIECLVGFAATAVQSGQPGAGVRLFSAAAAISERPSISVWKATQLEAETYLDLARSKLTDGKFQAEQTAGRALSLDQAVEIARQLQVHSRTMSRTAVSPEELTPREHEVAALIAQGKTNRQIADELVLSKRTVEKHVGNILARLELTSRTQVARWAIEKGLAHPSE